MALDKPQATKVVLGTEAGKLVRFSYLHVHKPHLNRESGTHEYSTQILIPKTNKVDYERIDAAVKEQQKLFFPSGKIPPRAHHPIKDGDTGVNQKGMPINQPGMWVVSAKSAAYEREGKQEILDKPTQPPGCVGTTKGVDGSLKQLSANEIKSGDWGRISLNCKGYTTGDGGVGFYLNNIQKVQDGELLGNGRRSAADEFGEFSDAEEFDPLA